MAGNRIAASRSGTTPGAHFGTSPGADPRTTPQAGAAAHVRAIARALRKACITGIGLCLNAGLTGPLCATPLVGMSPGVGYGLIAGLTAAASWTQSHASEPSQADPSTAGNGRTDWTFDALLDGKTIGSHRFALSREGAGVAQLDSEARFDVRLLGLTVYRYRHKATERWQGNCLASIAAQTDDDGRRTEVSGRETDDRFALSVAEGRSAPVETSIDGCLMSFAYWNPALAQQSRLLDPDHGRIVPVRIEALPQQSLSVQGRTESVRGLRITGLPQPIDVWYAGSRWVGLDTTVEGGRHLAYRLR